MPDEAKKEIPKTEILCLGRRVGRDNKLANVFILADVEDPSDTHPDVMVFGNTRHVKKYSAGNIYSLEMEKNEEGGSTVFFVSAPHAAFVRTYEDSEKRMAWQAASRAAEATVRKIGESAKVMKSEEFLHVLDPLRRIYTSADRLNKIAIEMTVLEYLRRPML